MQVLYIVGSCLRKNTSANMSHNAYVQGLLENGCNVDILMAKDSWGNEDSKLPIWENACYYAYPATAPQDKIRNWVRKLIPEKKAAKTTNVAASPAPSVSDCQRSRLRSWMKQVFYWIFPNDPCYPLERTWLANASRFHSQTKYDLVISNSSPAASHKLAYQLLQAKKISCTRWIQIWEDPWYADLYSSKSQIIFQEEHRLLTAATEIYYVSPLTLDYQKELFPDCASKMKHIPLPYLTYTQNTAVQDVCSFGYFGDYYSNTRNLLPFYQALRASGCRGYIYGDSDLQLESTQQINVSSRVTLDILEQVQEKTGILVHLCNLRGGQIPGKIYHYSATNKPILFILDGTKKEQEIIKTYFSQFNRYYFVTNQTDEIYNAIITITKSQKDYMGKQVKEFCPKNVVLMFL